MGHQASLRRIALAATSLLVALGAAEGVARLTYSPVLTFDDFVPWQDQEFTPPLNHLGLREGPIKDLPEETQRVLMLGDSFTWGHGLPDAADRFTDLMEARYNAEEEGDKVHTYNAAVPGTSPVQWSRKMPRVMSEYDADCVFAVFFLRDGTRLATSIEFHRDKIEEIKRRHHSALYDLSYLVRTIVDRDIAHEFSEWYQGEFINAYLGAENETRMWQRVQGHLRKIQSQCRLADIPFHLVIFPILLDLDDYRFGGIEAEIERFADEAEIACFSLTPGFIGQRAEDLWVSPSNQHPNAAGHQIAADTLYPYFLNVVRGMR